MSSPHDHQVVSTETVYDGRIITVRRDEVSMPGETTSVRDVVEHPGAVGVVALDEQGRVLLVNQYRHPVRRRLDELPAGLLDVEGEDPLLTAQRELVEEAGLHAEEWHTLVDVAASAGFTDEVVRVYLARGLSEVERPAGEDDEESDIVLHRVPLADAVRMTMAGELINGATVSGILAADAVLTHGVTPRAADTPWRDRPTAFAARLARQ